MYMPDIPCVTNSEHSLNVHKFYPPPSDQTALPLHIPPCVTTVRFNPPAFRWTHPCCHTPPNQSSREVLSPLNDDNTGRLPDKPHSHETSLP
ncbi:hypothetical protein K505DRAFT_368903 [Melanomma pulvis-pyrius CBS 109.77]|uniref:Uncharacterized protein n=1 Tax=Melanomma pulvis-pyrius CBS 109.77 TaxID=1314802 RepID=A0A6A6WP56_9PLEO|nr:hypothetical protein K505DRAFT_368903 [Melanomma pulvis-pyrius CBS 109.77]